MRTSVEFGAQIHDAYLVAGTPIAILTHAKDCIIVNTQQSVFADKTTKPIPPPHGHHDWQSYQTIEPVKIYCEYYNHNWIVLKGNVIWFDPKNSMI